MHHSTKYHVSLLKNKSGNFTFAKVKFGMYALQALESGILTAQQLEITRRIISRLTKRTSKLWMRVKVNIPLTAKPREIRMGKGKGEVSQHVRYIIRGQILFEIAAGKQNRSILLIAKRKLPLLTRIIERFDQI